MLSIKDIPAATDELKHRLQKARVQVRQLPDVERGTGEQEEEIRALEEKIGRQREVLAGLRGRGLEVGRERDGDGDGGGYGEGGEVRRLMDGWNDCGRSYEVKLRPLHT